MRLLLVEDSADLAAALAVGLQREGYSVDTAGNVEDALAFAAAEPYVVIVLDRMLPGGDGLDVCRTLRTTGVTTPILVLTARDAVEDRVAGLDAGADDYLVKPFALSELLARTRALTRRGGATRTNVLAAGGLTLDVTSGQVQVGDVEIAIGGKERRILTALLRYPGRVVTHGQLVEQAWSLGEAAAPEVVRAHIKNLRRKLLAVPGAPRIETVYGLGYRVVA